MSEPEAAGILTLRLTCQGVSQVHVQAQGPGHEPAEAVCEVPDRLWRTGRRRSGWQSSWSEPPSLKEVRSLTSELWSTLKASPIGQLFAGRHQSRPMPRLVLEDTSLAAIPWEWVFPGPEVRYTENYYPNEPSVLDGLPHFLFVSSSH